MAKKLILARNYEKCYIYFNKNNNFQDILLKIGMHTLYIVYLKRLSKYQPNYRIIISQIRNSPM